MSDRRIMVRWTAILAACAISAAALRAADTVLLTDPAQGAGNEGARGLTTGGDKLLFEDLFQGKLAPGWSFIRENTNGWRVTRNSLQIRIEPGNMWGPENSGKNVMVREAPDPSQHEVEVTVTVSNQPTAQYEQVDLVWYYTDGNMVKEGLELVDGKLSIVMGREENDRARTIAVIPIDAHQVQLRHRIKGNVLRGQYRPAGEAAWRDAGQCDLPARGKPRLAIQCYQGPKDAEHWATIQEFTVRALGE